MRHAAVINVRRRKEIVWQAVREEKKERPFVEKSENDHTVTTNDSIPRNFNEEHAHIVCLLSSSSSRCARKFRAWSR